MAHNGVGELTLRAQGGEGKGREGKGGEGKGREWHTMGLAS